MVRSSDPESPLTQVAFEWQMESPLITPEPSLSFLDLPMNETKAALIPINLRSISVCAECKVSIDLDAKSLQCEWLANPDAIRPDHRFEQGNPEQVLFGNLRLNFLPQLSNDQYFRTIGLSLTCKESPRARIAIPVRWSYIRSVTWTPSRLFLGTRSPGERVEKELFVKASQNEKVRLISFSITDATVRIESDLPDSPISQGFVSFWLTIPSKPGPWAETLILKTDKSEAAEIRIPISCLIGETGAK